ncbi:uncharacterized protein [Montipora capricornis]|uniref:uncharacterized protein isoform X2 n=1 Tax=Montipora capricornis TaxID=246305 RepID=UPI0035F1E771
MDVTVKHIYLFNCDKTYNLDVVESLLTESGLEFQINIVKRYFDLNTMAEMCEDIMSEPQMNFAIFVVHANESRLSINEENAGIGYAMIYKTLQRKTDNVIIVIGGDDNYKDKEEENRVVLSRWAWRKISNQFDNEYLDGRKSFIFSWDTRHREIHEEALLHYFDPSKKGEKFERKPKETTLPEESDEVKDTLTSINQKNETVIEIMDENQETVNDAPDTVTREIDTVIVVVIRDENQETVVATFTGLSANHYPEGTVLLDTHLCNGELSNDVLERTDNWWPPQEIVQSLKKNYSSTPEARVRLVVRKNGNSPCCMIL